MKRVIKGLENYSNKWVAVDSKKNEVILSALSYKDIIELLKKHKQEVFLLKLPPLQGSFSP